MWLHEVLKLGMVLNFVTKEYRKMLSCKKFIEKSIITIFI